MAEAIQYETEINGKEVKFKKSIPLRDGHTLRRFLRNQNSDDYNDDIPALRLLIEPCELVASPDDRHGFDDLDVFQELIPLINASAEYIVSKMAAGKAARG